MPISLFYSNNRGQFCPLAIQLEQEPGPNAPIFTPDDDYWLWTTVKGMSPEMPTANMIIATCTSR